MRRLQDTKESLIDILMLVKTCLTTFWFWLPVLFAIYFYIQLWMIFFVHPITVLILPLVLSVFMVLQEEKRTRAQYGLNEVKLLRASHPFGSTPDLEKINWDVEKAIEAYKESLEKEKNRQKKKNN